MPAIRASTIRKNWGLPPEQLEGWRRDLAADPDHIAYAEWVSSRLARSELLGPDADGVARLALCVAAKSYDPQDGAKFTTFATKHIRGALAQAVADDACQGFSMTVREQRAGVRPEMGMIPLQDHHASPKGPPPMPADPIVDRVRQKLRDRSERGQLKYGANLDRPDLAPLDWLRHAQEEALDFCLYLERLIGDAESVVGGNGEES